MGASWWLEAPPSAFPTSKEFNLSTFEGLSYWNST